MIRALRAALLALAAVATPPGAARSPRLAVAAAPAPALPDGISRVGEGALVLRPAALPAGARPLLVLFHGAGMSARQMLAGLAPEARRCGCLMLAVDSRGTTWDLITATRTTGRRGTARLDSLFDDDATRVEAALSTLLASPLVDRRQVALVGFSDGASYALSLALANPGLVRGAVAIAPGFHLEPAAIDPAQRLFIAHSPRDRVLSFENSRDRIVGSLRNAGFDPVFHIYDGGHSIDPAVVAIGVDHVLGPRLSTSLGASE